MTREDFLSGVEFEMGSSYFKLDKDQRSITKVYRSIDPIFKKSRVVMEDYHMNIEKIGKVQFECYTFLLGKRIVRKVRFDEVEVFKG